MKNRPLLLATLSLGTSLPSCATATTRSVEGDVAKALVTSDQENQLGLQLKTDLEQKQGVVYLNDPQVVGYVRGIADKVIQLGKKDRATSTGMSTSSTIA